MTTAKIVRLDDYRRQKSPQLIEDQRMAIIAACTAIVVSIAMIRATCAMLGSWTGSERD